MNKEFCQMLLNVGFSSPFTRSNSQTQKLTWSWKKDKNKVVGEIWWEGRARALYLKLRWALEWNKNGNIGKMRAAEHRANTKIKVEKWTAIRQKKGNTEGRESINLKLRAMELWYFQILTFTMKIITSLCLTTETGMNGCRIAHCLHI